MTFLDEEERQVAIRVARGAVGRTAVALGLTFAAPLVAVFLGPLFGLAVGVAAIGLAASSVNMLRHPQSSVIGGLRVVGLLIGGGVLLIGAIGVVYGTWQYMEWRRQAAELNRVEQLVH